MHMLPHMLHLGVDTPTQSGADTPETEEPIYTAENFAASANRATDKETLSSGISALAM
jgi:hypothetical protein